MTKMRCPAAGHMVGPKVGTCLCGWLAGELPSPGLSFPISHVDMILEPSSGHNTHTSSVKDSGDAQASHSKGSERKHQARAARTPQEAPNFYTQDLEDPHWTPGLQGLNVGDRPAIACSPQSPAPATVSATFHLDSGTASMQPPSHPGKIISPGPAIAAV